MNGRHQTEHEDQSDADGTGKSFGATDVAAIIDSLGVAELPVLKIVGLLILLPFAALDLVGAMPLLARGLRRFGRLFDYRRYLNGGMW